MAGKMQYESLLTGIIDLDDIALMNEALDLQAENERRAAERPHG